MLSLTLPWIWRHPFGRRHRFGSLGRYLHWQLHQRLRPVPCAIPWVNGTRLLLQPGLHGLSGNYYCGLHEWPDMAFVLHLLRPEDTFVDIGANAGSYTVLAAGAIGCHCESFEPVPSTHRQLLTQIALNQLQDRVQAHACALGEAPGELLFSIDRDSMNRVVEASYRGRITQVPVQAIDQLPQLRHACCWKLDVEGHESQVLAGACLTLREAPPPALLCEDRSAAVQARLLQAGFQPMAYDPFRRQLCREHPRLPAQHSSGNRNSPGNQLWIREHDWVQQRLATAPPFSLLREWI